MLWVFPVVKFGEQGLVASRAATVLQRTRTRA
jgi:hypothetical protein